MGNLSGEEYRFALENTSLSTEPNCGTSLCIQVSLLWSSFYLFSFVSSFFVNIIRYLVFHQPKLSKEGIWNLLGWEFRWGCDGLMPNGARRRRPPTIFPPTRVFTTLKANTNINSNTNTTAHASEKYEQKINSNIGARRRRPPAIVFTTLKVNTNIYSNTIGYVNEKY